MLEFFTSMAFLWLVIIVIAAICEAQTSSLVAIWFIPAAVVSMILALLKTTTWVQVIVFFAISLLLLILSRSIFKKFIMRGKIEATNADAIIGEKGIVTEEIDNIKATGAVKIGALTWTARSPDDNIKIPVGEIVTVSEISGVKVICNKTEK